MTALPATQVGLVDRGLIAGGMVADITVFDPETVIDHATYDEPEQYSEGIEYVFVHGRLALREGEVTGVRAGEAVRRTPHMPTRPESFDRDVTVATSGVMVSDHAGPGKRPVRVSFSVRQDAGGPGEASGRLELVDPRTRERLESVSIGQVHAADNWSDFTGVGGDWASSAGTGRLSSGEEVPPDHRGGIRPVPPGGEAHGRRPPGSGAIAAVRRRRLPAA